MENVFSAFRNVRLEDGREGIVEIPLSYADDPIGQISVFEAIDRGYDIGMIKDKDGKSMLSEDQVAYMRAIAAGTVPNIDEDGKVFMLPTLSSMKDKYEAQRKGQSSVFTMYEKVHVKDDSPKAEVVLNKDFSCLPLQRGNIYVGPRKDIDVQKYLKDGEYEREKKLPAMICDWLVQNYLIRIWREEIYLFNINKKYFEKMKNQGIDYIINQNFGEKIKGTGSPATYELARSFLRREAKLVVPDEWQVPKYSFAFRNVFYDSLTGELLVNDGSIFTPHALDAEYDLTAECPEFEAFVDSVSCHDDNVKELIWEALGYLISNDLSAKSFFVLVGEKDTGKSLFANLVTKIIGEAVTKHLSLSDFSGRFALADLQGAHLNVCMDLPDAPLSADAIGRIKSYTGNDGIRSDVKNKDAISFTPTAHLLFGSNHRVTTSVRDIAFEERLVQITFTNPVPKERQDPDLLEKLYRERNGICRKAIAAYIRLRGNSYIFPMVGMKGACCVDKETILKDFVENKLEFTGDETDFAATADIFKLFQSFCEELRLDLGLRSQQFSVLLTKCLPASCGRVKKRVAGYPNPVNGINCIKIRL